MADESKIKTWGRELAVAAVGFWMILTLWYFNMNTPEMVTAFSPGYSTASLSLWAFIASMFGVDKVVKHGHRNRSGDR